MKVNVLSRLEIKSGGPSEHTFYEVWDDKQRKDYLEKHPGSKFSNKNQKEEKQSQPSNKTKEPKKVRRVSSKNPKDKPVVDALNEKILPKLADTGIDSKVSSN